MYKKKFATVKILYERLIIAKHGCNSLLTTEKEEVS